MSIVALSTALDHLRVDAGIEDVGPAAPRARVIIF